MSPRRFFIAGAFKSGTSALASYLSGHPDVAMSSPKEPYFFAEDFPRLRRASNLQEYARLFPQRGPEAWLGEASAGYLVSESALAAIRRFDSAARLIVLLRRPDELVRAFHGELLYARDECRDFATAWRLEPERRAGRYLPRRCRTPAFLRYREVGRLGSQVARMFDVFPRQQVRVFLFDDLRADAGSVYRQALRFLDLPDDGRSEFAVVNPHKRHRWARLGDWTQRPPRAGLAAARWIKQRTGLQRLGVLDAVRRWNAPPTPRAALAPALAREVWETFLPEVERLEQLLERDLSAWKAPP